MLKLKTVSTRVEDDLLELVRADADASGQSISEWLSDAIFEHLNFEGTSFEDLCEMSWDELVDFVEEDELNVEVSQYRGGLLSPNDKDGLVEAIAEELGLEDDYEDEDEDEDED